MAKPFEDIRGRLVVLEAARQNISAQAAPHVISTAETDMRHLLSAVDALMEVVRHERADTAFDDTGADVLWKLRRSEELFSALPPEIREAFANSP